MARRRGRRRRRQGGVPCATEFVELVAPRPQREVVLEGGDARGTWVRIVVRGV